jgi:hypothetical protein
MRILVVSIAFLLSSTLSIASETGEFNNPEITPGSFCSESDPNFKEFRYLERIPICRRNVSTERKDKVMIRYGINPSNRTKYIIDHCIALVLGGSNKDDNLWPQPKNSPVAEAKYKYEFSMYQKLLRGEVKYEDVIQGTRERFCLPKK